MSNKEQLLTFALGITNVPSDPTSDDNSLEESVGMFFTDGEHRVVQRPSKKMELTGTLIYVHRYNNQIRYIVKRETDVAWTTDSVTYTHIADHHGKDVHAESVGNTLIVSTDVGLNYLLWDYTKKEYKILGNRIPEITVDFGLVNQGEWQTHYDTTYPTRFYLGNELMHVRKGAEYLVTVGEGDQQREEVQNLLYLEHKEGMYDVTKDFFSGIVVSRLNRLKELKRFAFPFWARSAIRLYDGSHIYISNPYLLLPTVKNNWYIFMATWEDHLNQNNIKIDLGTAGSPIEMDEQVTDGRLCVNYRPYSGELAYKVGVPAGVNLSDWDDIIAGVDIFVSEEARTFDLNGDWKICDYRTTESNPGTSTVTLTDICSPGYEIPKDIAPISEAAMLDHVIHKYHTIEKYDHTYADPDHRKSWRCFFKPALYSDNEIIDQLINNSTFYRVLELDLDDVRETGWKNASDKMSRTAIQNLTTQTQLEYDDYFSHTDIIPKAMRTYNKRLHMANVDRGFYDGFGAFAYAAYDDPNATFNKSYIYYVHIKSESGERIVRKIADKRMKSVSVASNFVFGEIADLWFYYPDPRAYKVEIFSSDGSLIKELPLKEHPNLNGAYYFKRLPDSGETLPSGTGTQPETITTPETLEDTLIVSETNNPWVFTAKGYVEVGMGEILGMASQTVALGQEEHGIHPLIVFTDCGIWTLRLNEEGVYVRSDALSREVLNNPRSVTETDGAVYFSSEKGLMVVVGNDVKCVSEQLSGKSNRPFQDYIRKAFVAYDYRDSLLWILDGGGGRYCWLYSMKTGTFSRYDFGEGKVVTSAVNYYPDYLLQVGGEVFSLLERRNINEDEDQDYEGLLITRPLKLDNAMALKSIMRLRNVKEFAEGSLVFSMEGSNDLKSWRRLTTFRGIPWKYYRFRYDFSSMTATDRFSGTVLITQERRTNKLR